MLRWTWRVCYYGYAANGTDLYPPFTLRDEPGYPTHVEVDYPDKLSRGLVLIKWWLLAIPHLIVVGLFAGGTWVAVRFIDTDLPVASGLRPTARGKVSSPARRARSHRAPIMDAGSVLGAPAGARLPTMVSERPAKKFSRNLKERVIEVLPFFAAFVSVFTTVGIVYILVKESFVFFSQVPVWDFLTDSQWTPLFSDAHFGITVLLSGTLTSSAVALAIAIPLGTIIAIYLSEFAGHKTRETLKPALELLSGVPTIIYGYFALLFVT